MNKHERTFVELAALALHIPGTGARKGISVPSYEDDMQALLKLHIEFTQAVTRGGDPTGALERLLDASVAAHKRLGALPPEKVTRWLSQWESVV